MSEYKGSSGRSGFIDTHKLWSDEQCEVSLQTVARVREAKLETVRFAFADQHGLLRGKTLLVDEFESAMRSGITATTSLLLKDTSHRTVFPIWAMEVGLEMERLRGAADCIMVPDPTTFRVLPWSGRTGWILCDLYFSDGDPVPFSTRQACRAALDRLTASGYQFRCGIEVEFHLFKREEQKLHPKDTGQPGAPPEVTPLGHGYQYLSEARMDAIEPVVDLIRREVVAMGLPLRTIEVEFGPSQVEFTFAPLEGLRTADLMVLFRSATKQICRRHGYHATFMCRPAFENFFSSGWHLHQSLLDRTSGVNAFMPDNDISPLSVTGKAYMAGLLKHAEAACVFTTPTITGYKRYRPHSLAPDRIHWARDNRGAMLRVLGDPGNPGTRIENRVGEAAANPYLYLASQIHAGLDGIEHGLSPPPSADTPYATDAPWLPRSLVEAMAALNANAMYRKAFGDTFVDYILAIKEAEISRFFSEVTDWEQREYFDLF